MRTVGFPISPKENENRRAILPDDLSGVHNCDRLFFEDGYGEVLGYSNRDYEAYGVHIVNRHEVLSKDVICDPKIGDADYLGVVREGQIVFGWIHAVQNKAITDKILNAKATAIAWEDMYYEGRHSFWRNNEVAGEAAIMHAFQCFGKMPYGLEVALIGQGNTSRGAMKMLTLLGAHVSVYNRKTENLFRKEFPKYDVIVNCILWDTSRTDHLLYEEDLKKMKKGSLIIDVSCDSHGGIETSEATTIETPTFIKDGVMHYAVDHTPSLFYKTATEGISSEVAKFLDDICTEKSNEVLEKATIIKNGIIIDQRINKFQNR